MRPSRSSASALSGRDRFLGEVARGHHERCAHLGKQQVVQRRVGEHDAHLAQATGDRVGDRGSRRRRAAAAARSGARCRSAAPPRRRRCGRRRGPRRSSATMIASGLPQRCLRSRRRATASSLVASHARWKPPSPLIARMRPSRRSERRRRDDRVRPAAFRLTVSVRPRDVSTSVTMRGRREGVAPSRVSQAG